MTQPRHIPCTAPRHQRQLSLVPGQPLRLWLPAGAIVLSQTVHLHVTVPPRLLGERLAFPHYTLDDGQALLTEHAGWFDLETPQGGMVICQWPRTWQQRAVATLAHLWRRASMRLGIRILP